MDMDYVKPADVAVAMVETGRRKLALAPRDLLIRGMLSGAILGVATSLAFTGAVQTNVPLVGALIFPVGLISIVLLGLELVTGSFALVPLPWLEREASARLGAGQLGLGFHRQPDRQRRLWRADRHRADQYGSDRAGRRRRAHRADRRSQDHRLRGSRLCRPGHACFVKAMLCNWLVCLARRARHDHDLDHRQDRLRLDADLHLLRPRVRALRRQHVHHPDRHDDGRQGHRRRLVAVESDSGDARQSGRRFHLHRPRHLHDLQAAARPARFWRRHRPACPPSSAKRSTRFDEWRS